MKYGREVTLKDGRKCYIKGGAPEDAGELLRVFVRTHEETDYLLSYPDENAHTLEEEREFLKGME